MNPLQSFRKIILVIQLVLTISLQSAFAQAPSITSFTPANGTIGTLVTISGTDLSNPSSLTIGGKAATIVSNDGTTLTAMVMPGTLSGAVSITTAMGSATASDIFITRTNNPPNIQQAKLVATGNTGSPRLGGGVSISADGNTAVAGGYTDNNLVGAAWVFTRTNGVWTQQGTKLVGTGYIGTTPRQGEEVAISADGNTILVGGASDNSNNGSVWVFVRNNGIWTQQAKLIGNVAGGVNFGFSVAISADGNTALIGGTGGFGRAFIFTRDATGVWTQQGNWIQGSGMTTVPPAFGHSVALSADGNTALIGGHADDFVQGAFWIYTRNNGVWTQQGPKYTVSGAAPGQVLAGNSVALSADGNTALIGGPRDNNYLGAAWVFTRNNGVWTQQGNKLVGTGNILQSEQGWSVALSADGNIAVMSGVRDRAAPGGALWIFTRHHNGIWTQTGSKVICAGNVTVTWLGESVAISADGTTVIAGGEGDNFDVGAAWIFRALPGTLPLRWLTVNASFISNTEVKVEWSTATEINNSYFEVQRSAVSSFAQVVTVGTIQGAGNTSTTTNYQLTDRHAFVSGQSYFYRIKQVDIDGRVSYSPVVLARAGNEQKMSWHIYPNPIPKNRSINLVVTGGTIRNSEIIQVSLINSTGQIVYEIRDVSANIGDRVGKGLQKLSAGLYTIHIKQESANYFLQVVVQD